VGTRRSLSVRQREGEARRGAPQGGDRYALNVQALDRCSRRTSSPPTSPSGSARRGCRPTSSTRSRRISGCTGCVHYSRALAKWTVNDARFRGRFYSVQNTEQWGTGRKPATRAAPRGAEPRRPVVTDRTVDAGREGTAPSSTRQETIAAREKQQAQQDEFKAWMWTDAPRASGSRDLQRHDEHDARVGAGRRASDAAGDLRRRHASARIRRTSSGAACSSRTRSRITSSAPARRSRASRSRSKSGAGPGAQADGRRAEPSAAAVGERRPAAVSGGARARESEVGLRAREPEAVPEPHRDRRLGRRHRPVQPLRPDRGSATTRSTTTCSTNSTTSRWSSRARDEPGRTTRA
jgi:hypothetical protein